MKSIDKNPSPADEKTTPSKRGPAPVRESRQETYRVSSKNRRQRLLDEGKVELKLYVNPETKAVLQAFKEQHGLDSLQTALDEYVKQQSEKK